MYRPSSPGTRGRCCVCVPPGNNLATRGGAADRDRGSPGYIEGHLPSRDPNRPARPLPLQPVLPAANTHIHPAAVRGGSAATETHPGPGAPGDWEIASRGESRTVRLSRVGLQTQLVRLQAVLPAEKLNAGYNANSEYDNKAGISQGNRIDLPYNKVST